jgi:hypothetical protein
MQRGEKETMLSIFQATQCFHVELGYKTEKRCQLLACDITTTGTTGGHLILMTQVTDRDGEIIIPFNFISNYSPQELLKMKRTSLLEIWFILMLPE